MPDLGTLLQRDPVVATAGIDVLADAVEAQAGRVARTDWRPPTPGTPEALTALAEARRTGPANRIAVERLLAVRPQLIDVVPAHVIVPGLSDGTLLHAGPPIEWDDCSGPLRGALIGAILYEGLAGEPEDAIDLAPSIELSPCHHHGAVGPMAGVMSPSMPVAVIGDAAGSGVAYATLNEGLGKVLRYGAYAPEVIDRLRWMERVLGPTLADVVHRRGPIDLESIITQALQMGDDGHNRNRASTSLFLRAIGADLIASDARPLSDRVDVFGFIDRNDHFMLNLIMAAGKLAVDAASGVDGSSLVTTMARNGTEFGIRLSGTGDAWFTAPAPFVDGLYLGAFTAADANPDIGDSAITETVGLGGFAMAAAPAIVGFVGGTASGAIRRTPEMYEITLT
ncbi:MAG: DUF1116 domain-containing protein, partial [Acidimicrobiia bacterium]|nr:DUF1116 domain-containing protein [Acidimicrobiia bacterium]